MKKLQIKITLLVVIVLLGSIFMGQSYAAISCNVNLTASKTQLTYGEEFSVEVAISNLNASDGIIALSAVLDYDKTALTYVDMTVAGNGKWSAPIYNSEGGKLVSTRSALGNTDESVFKIVFKVKENAGNSAWIKISDFTISGGQEEQNVGGNSITVKIGTASQGDNTDSQDQDNTPPTSDNTQNGNTNNNPTNNNENNTQNGNTTNKPNTNDNGTSKDSKLPQLGYESMKDNKFVIGIIAVALVLAVIFGTRIILLNKKQKNK